MVNFDDECIKTKDISITYDKDFVADILSLAYHNGEKNSLNSSIDKIQEAYLHGYLSGVNDMMEITYETEDLNTMADNSDIRERLARLETHMEHVLSGIEGIKDQTKELPELKHKINQMHDRSVWWKQLILAPIITGVITGIIVFILTKI